MKKILRLIPFFTALMLALVACNKNVLCVWTATEDKQSIIVTFYKDGTVDLTFSGGESDGQAYKATYTGNPMLKDSRVQVFQEEIPLIDTVIEEHNRQFFFTWTTENFALTFRKTR